MSSNGETPDDRRVSDLAGVRRTSIVRAAATIRVVTTYESGLAPGVPSRCQPHRPTPAAIATGAAYQAGASQRNTAAPRDETTFASNSTRSAITMHENRHSN